jgi:hypothetical protein
VMEALLSLREMNWKPICVLFVRRLNLWKDDGSHGCEGLEESSGKSGLWLHKDSHPGKEEKGGSRTGRISRKGQNIVSVVTEYCITHWTFSDDPQIVMM